MKLVFGGLGAVHAVPWLGVGESWAQKGDHQDYHMRGGEKDCFYIFLFIYLDLYFYISHPSNIFEFGVYTSEKS